MYSAPSLPWMVSLRGRCLEVMTCSCGRVGAWWQAGGMLCQGGTAKLDSTWEIVTTVPTRRKADITVKQQSPAAHLRRKGRDGDQRFAGDVSARHSQLQALRMGRRQGGGRSGWNEEVQ